ncbi:MULTISPECIES: Do family serine endopeptidase [Hydrogenophaga]|uniref:Probable periplasmic serine endoprotease DegP-like n=1 Tax=Hydrogenophaga intermedia TaxID=65786 RepID=A0A1L1PZ84_HYDIT|nr:MULTISPECIES: Do family serine endopeptidase [Hydrogenophaga]AOS77736.1 peptidase [Hydrogenophaga sp. PBC]CDN90555.1 Protease Do [Hydrogenophaga intermedia]
MATNTRYLRHRLLPLVAAMLVSGAVGGLTVGWGLSRQAEPGTAPAATPTAFVRTAAPVTAPGAGQVDFAAIAQANGAAVVNISVSGTRRVGLQGEGPRQGISPFGFPFPFPDGGEAPRNDIVRGQGSGFIVDKDGVILTNAHVVDGASRVTVKLPDRREFQARVLGTDPMTDVAVLKIEAKDLPTVPLGSEKDLRVGDWVLAIGSPYGFENTATVGVVSAKGRSLPDESYVPFIQTDAAINPGNSGGPLFNAKGQVVGINSQIFSHTGGYQGLAFSIPIDVALKVKDQIVKTGQAQHARLGVAAQDVNQPLAESFGLDAPRGALVAQVEPGSPADKAGLRSGDVILRVGKDPVERIADLPLLVGQAAPGERVEIGYWRDGREAKTSVELASAADSRTASAKGDGAAGSEHKLGLMLRPLSEPERRASGARQGLVIEDVTGAAELAGVQAGDLLVGINGKPVNTVDEVKAEARQAKQSIALQLMRDGATLFVPLRVG